MTGEGVFPLLASPDADLLSMLRRIEAAEHRCAARSRLLDSRPPGHPGREQAIRDAHAAFEQRRQLIGNACQIPAHTQQGLHAKARLLQSLNHDGELFNLVGQSIARDMVGAPPARRAI